MLIVNELGWLLTAFASIVLASNVALILVVRSVYKRIRRNRVLTNATLRTRA